MFLILKIKIKKKRYFPTSNQLGHEDGVKAVVEVALERAVRLLDHSDVLVVALRTGRRYRSCGDR